MATRTISTRLVIDGEAGSNVDKYRTAQDELGIKACGSPVCGASEYHRGAESKAESPAKRIRRAKEKNGRANQGTRKCPKSTGDVRCQGR